MTMEDIEATPGLLAKKIPEGSRILVQWHGGEPTLLGHEFMASAIKTLKQDKRFEWSFGIQTNLTTYDNSWAELYKSEFDGEVGVSWDPKIRLTRGGSDEVARNKKFEDAFWPSLRQLVSDGLSPYLVVTTTKVLFETFRNPMEWFDKVTREGVTHGHLERITKTGYARKDWDTLGVSNAEYSHHMSRWYRAYKLWNETNPERRIAMSPFDGLEQETTKLAKDGGTGGYGCWSGHCDTTFHTIDSNGYKAGCTAVTSETDNSKADTQAVQWFGKTPQTFVKARETRKAPCEVCDFKNICNTGCLTVEKMDDSGECSGAKRLFETVRKYTFSEK
jgi:radical SAM protein with 4Fe4S-binding SPASM domain